MYKHNHPLFISLKVNENSVYDKMINHAHNYDVENILAILKEFIKNNRIPIGISIYGNIFTDSSENNLKNYFEEFFDFCKNESIQLGYDCNTNDLNADRITVLNNYFDLYRLFIYSLDDNKNNLFFSENSLENVKKIVMSDYLKNKGKVMVVPITKYNIEELYELCNFSIKNGFKFNPLYLPVSTQQRIVTKEMDIKAKQQFINTVKELYNKYPSEVYLDVPCSFKTIGIECICNAGLFSIDISGDGKIKSCKFSNKLLGDINNLTEIWNNFERTINSNCSKCAVYNNCGGGCLVDVEDGKNPCLLG